ncbi:MAG TPA: hypothetical protein VHH10_00075 [Rubrobacteraceae bacterium]|jgi:hypothetical protein|nr:hypothetical protein [Rubrobacteraceae bacterium]
MYLFDPNHPTEMFHERREMLAREVRVSRLTSQLRAARRSKTTSEERMTRLSGRAIASWGRTSVPHFRA